MTIFFFISANKKLNPPLSGAYVLSRNALVDMYYTSYFTQLFRFDDIWLGLIAQKADLEPFHCDEFHYYRKPYSVRGYRYVVASHGFSEPTELQRVWTQQKEAGNAWTPAHGSAEPTELQRVWTQQKEAGNTWILSDGETSLKTPSRGGHSEVNYLSQKHTSQNRKHSLLPVS